MLFRRIAGIAALCTTLTFPIGPASAAGVQKGGVDSKRPAAGEPQPVFSDETLQRAIEKRIAASKIATNGFTVAVSGGVATISGTTEIPQHKGVATRLARSAGAGKVVNRITISQGGLEKLRKSREKKSRENGSSADKATGGKDRPGQPGTEPNQESRQQGESSSEVKHSSAGLPPTSIQEEKEEKTVKRFEVLKRESRGEHSVATRPRRY